jgi:D-glycero-alpha-D-manno-heptose-7-phosphate kinase
MIARARAPLRLGFAGGGTDVSPFCDTFGGYVLNATIDLYGYAHIRDRDDGMLHIAAPDIGDEFVGPAEPQLELTQPLALHKAVINRIVRDFRGGTPLSVDVVTHCDAPPGSGLGSSSTLVVAMIKAFVEWLRLPLGEYDVARLAFEIERRDLGWAGGRQDQYAATFGGFNFMEFYAGERIVVNPLRVKNWILSELETSLILYFTGVSRLSSAIIDEQVQNVAAGNATSIGAMHELKADAMAIKEAVLKGDFPQLSYYLERSWQAKKRMANGVSNGHIERAFEIAKDAGALAGKISGAGGGGFAFFVVDPTNRVRVVEALTRIGGEVRPCRFTKNGTEGWRLD